MSLTIRRRRRGRTGLAPLGGQGRHVPSLSVDSPGQMPGEVHATPLEVEGWAWSESGIDRVVVQIDDELEYDAFLGIPRPDIAAALGAPAARDVGFTCPLGTDVLPPGTHRLRVIAVARDGRSALWSAEIRTRRWGDEPPGQPASPADSPRPVIADPDQDGSDPMFERLVQVEGELALAHYNLTEARAQAEYAVRRERLTDQAIEQLAEERRLRAELVNSTSWRITRPLRALGRALGRARGAIGRR